MFAIANGRKALWQWDLNQQLTVAGDCTEVHYLDRGAPSTLTVAVKDGKADIPNILLQKAGRLVVYAYIVDAQDHHTKVCETFGIASRPKPAEYVYTETEVKTWSDLQSQIGDLADLATEEKDNLVAAINEAAQTGGGGGGGTYYVELNGNYPNYTLSETTPLTDIAEAYNEGKALFCRCSMDIYTATLPLFVPIVELNTWIFSGSGGAEAMNFSAQYFTIAVSAQGVTAENKRLVRTDAIVTSVSSSSTNAQVPSAKCVYDELQKRNLKQATSEVLGGVKADPATADDTQPVRINDSGNLVTAAGAVSDAQVSSAVSTWLTEHPEATTTVQDGAITPAKTSFLVQEDESIMNLGEYKKTFFYAITNNGSYYIHAWNKNYNFKADITGLTKISINATAAYINYVFFAEAPTGEAGQAIVGYGGTFASYTRLNDTDANEPTTQTVTIDVPTGAVWLMVDFGYAQPTDLTIEKPIELWKFGEQIDKTVNGADISDKSINTLKLENEAVTTEKLADKSVSTDKLAGYEITCKEVPWKIFLDGYDTNYAVAISAPDSAVYVVKLEAGKTYVLLDIPYPQNNNEFVKNNVAVGHPGHYFGYVTLPDVESNKTEGKNLLDGMFSSGIIHTIGREAILRGYMEPKGGTAVTSGYGPSWYVKVTSDFYIAKASLKPPAGKRINNALLYEVDSSEYTTIGNFPSSVYKMDLGNGYLRDTSYLAQVLSSRTAKAEDERSYAAMSRDVPRDRSLSIQFIGDSITYAASNAGLQNAFRKYVPMDFQAESNTLCQSGVSVTTGSGSFDWNGNQNSSESYDVSMSGYSGLVQKLVPYKTQLSLKVWADAVDIVIVELGTNDQWEQATLGAPTDLSEDTNFYGAVEKTLQSLENTFPNAQILWMLPFKNQKWKTSTIKMTSYLTAIKIICQTHKRCWVLDLFDKWFVNYDDPDIRSAFFIDGVHITGSAHKCVAESIVEKIRHIISICGLHRIKTNHITSGNDSVYGNNAAEGTA